MTSPTTEEAKTIIDAAPSYGPLRPVEYAAALPPRAGALARVLQKMEIVDAARDYARADADAGDAQGQFNRLGWTAAYSGFSAAVLGGILLYMGSDPSTATIRANLGLLQSLFLSVSLLCALVLVFFKPYRGWRNRRGDAEVKRLQIFALMMKANEAAAEGEAPLLPLQLECFRRHLFHDQRDFFTRRGRQQSMTVLAWRVVGAFALLLVLASLFPQLVRLQALGLLPDALQKLVAGLPLDQKHYVLAGLIGGSLQGLLAALAVMSPAERNAGKYREMRGLFERYTSEDLAAARAAAAAGDVDLVREFAVRNHRGFGGRGPRVADIAGGSFRDGSQTVGATKQGYARLALEHLVSCLERCGAAAVNLCAVAEEITTGCSLPLAPGRGDVEAAG